MNVFILGAGASKGYKESKTNQSMPLANDFFKTYNKLDISTSPYVLVGDIVNYLRDNKNMGIEEFYYYNANIEEIHSEINEKLIDCLKVSGTASFCEKTFKLWRANSQLVFLFNSVINEIQNGGVSKTHVNFIDCVNNEDTIITFNWDTLLDRTLKEKHKKWTTDNGYYINPKAIYRDKWVASRKCGIKDYPLLLKLHGSTNWLTSYLSQENGEIFLSQATANEIFYVYEYCTEPYSTYRGRFLSGYEDFSYGYYPPNIPEKPKMREGYYTISVKTSFDSRIKNNDCADIGLTSMPLIIPPVKNKEYDLYGSLFDCLWNKAEEKLRETEKIYIIGYSFPTTDIKSVELFKRAFSQRKSMPEVIVINPFPQQIHEKLKFEFGIDDEHLRIREECFDETFSL